MFCMFGGVFLECFVCLEVFFLECFVCLEVFFSWIGPYFLEILAMF